MMQSSTVARYRDLHQRIATEPLRGILDELVRHCMAAKVPLVPVRVARLLFTLARVASPRHIVELGTGFGYSALLLALASSTARIVTVENDPERGRVAGTYFAQAGVEGRISLMVGDAISFLQTAPGPFDFVFLDAAKEEYLSYLVLLLPHLASGALLVADDVHFAGEMPDGHLPAPAKERVVHELEQFRHCLTRQDYFLTSFLPIDCGLSVTLLTGHPDLQEGTVCGPVQD